MAVTVRAEAPALTVKLTGTVEIVFVTVAVAAMFRVKLLVPVNEKLEPVRFKTVVAPVVLVKAIEPEPKAMDRELVPVEANDPVLSVKPPKSIVP